jgi:pantothenate kinase
MREVQNQLLSLSSLSTSQLKAEWRLQMRGEPPDVSADLLERALAYELQAKAHGGLAPSRRRELERLSKQLARSGSLGSARETSLRPGVRLARDWHGRTHHVLVTDDGFLYEERRYMSLSQIATAITGTKWSGPRFFGLRRSSGAGEAQNGQS